MTQVELKDQVKALLDSGSSDIINSFFGSDFDEDISKYDCEEDAEFKNTLAASGIKVKHVDTYGGEDCGSKYWSIYEFSLTNKTESYSVYVKFNGYYISYDGSTFDEWFFAKAVPKSGYDYVAE